MTHIGHMRSQVNSHWSRCIVHTRFSVVERAIDAKTKSVRDYTRIILFIRIISGYNSIMEQLSKQASDGSESTCTAFQGSKCLSSGTRDQVMLFLKERRPSEHQGAVLVFDDVSGDQIELDLRNVAPNASGRSLDDQEKTDPSNQSDLPDTLSAGPGRPRLGVVPREVTLLPRHWEWLNRQPGGASVALRKLVEEARRTHAEQDLRRQSQSAAYKFMTAMAGDRPGYEEAVRALFAAKRVRFELEIERWPADIRSHSLRLAAASFGDQA